MSRAHWPLFDLTIRTQRLELRYASDDLLLTLCDVAHDVIQPGTAPFDGDASFYDPSPAGRRRWLAGQWSARARTSPEWWCLVFAVIVDGQPVGTQEITGAAFPAKREVETFSWLTRSAQGHGFGAEMRAAILELAFAGLGAERAVSEAFTDNAASCAVSRKLGYDAESTFAAARPAEMTRFVLSRAAWHPRPPAGITVEHLEPCLPLLGLGVPGPE